MKEIIQKIFEKKEIVGTVSRHLLVGQILVKKKLLKTTILLVQELIKEEK